MITEPAHPTARYIEGRIAFDEEGAAFYEFHGQRQLAKWSREQVKVWTEKLEALKAKAQGREPGDGE
jgi:hypothetical protein